MTSMNPGPEDQLTRSLSAQADAFAEHGGAPVELSSVLDRAGEIRRGRRMRASIVMAAAVLAVAVPVAITSLDGGPDHQPRIATSPTPTPSPTATAPADAVARIPLGAAPEHSYVLSGTLHDVDGSVHRLPAAATMALITPYLGGYLVAPAESNIVMQYDGTGRLVKSGTGPAQFATTSDGVVTAYAMNGILYSNPGSGMASGDGAVGPVDRTSGMPIGYLPGGLLYVKNVTPSGSPEFAVTGGGSLGHDLASLTAATATDDVHNLVAGRINATGTVISLATHQALWSSPTWSPIAFSYDGKYVAATSVQGSDAVAILDARTGRVLASRSLAEMGISLSGGPVFDDSGNLLFAGSQTLDRGQAILRLSPHGALTRATKVVAVSVSTDVQNPFSFPVGPQ